MNIGTRKLIWSVPLVAVLAVAGALAIFAAQMPGTALAHDPPGVVTDLALTKASQTEIKLSWKAPTTGGAVDSYRIDKSKDAHIWMLLTDSAPGDKQSYSDTTVEQGELRYYRVFAVNSAGIGPVSEVEGEQTSGAVGPGPVTGLKAAPASGNDGRSQIVLSWNAPAKTGGSPIKEYRGFYAVTGANPLPFTNLDNGATPPVPTAPVDDDGGADNAIIGTGSDATTFTHKTLTHLDTNPGLSPNTTYRYKIVAVNKAGQVSETAPEIRGATTKKVGNPTAPTGLTAVASATGVIQLYWYHPADTGGATITEFRVHQKSGSESWPDADAIGTVDGVTAVPAPTATGGDAEINHPVTGLADGTTYQFRVYAAHDATADSPISGKSNTVTATPLDTPVVPDAPALETAPENLEGERDPKGVVTLTWDRPTTAVTPAILSYRIDVSDDGYKWDRLIESTSFTKGVYRYDDPKRGVGVTRYYRVFARNRHGFSSASEILEVTADSADAPGLVRNLTAKQDATDPTKIHLTWDAPSADGGADLVGYCIDYAVTMSPASGTGFDDQDLLPAQPDDTTNCADTEPTDTDADDDATGGRVKIEVEVPETGDPNPPTSYTLEDLKAQDTVQFRVVANNLDVSEVRMYGDIAIADMVAATTIKAARPGAPTDLTAEAARDSNLSGTSNRGVNLLWNAPENAGLGVTIDGYHIQVSTDGSTTWTDVEDDTGDLLTYYTHDSEPAAGEVRVYRVATIDDQATTDESLWSNMVYYPHALAQPGKPTLTAMKDADMPGTKVKLTWTAPDMNADLVTGYIIERRHAGDMMGDIPSDGYNDGVMGRSHAFMDYKEWWETLNCKGMLAVAGSSASVTATTGESAQDTADRDMYCKHFANTAPTKMAFAGKTVSEATAMKIKEMFMKRYVTDDMGKTMTMFTGMMHTDMGLMENTEYTYRVRAIHGMKAGMWSDKVMVTTTTNNTSPVDGPDLTATVTAGDMTTVQSTISDPDTGDTLTWAITTTSTDATIATATVNATTGMVTITGVAAGEATITVTATDTAGAMATQDISVTVGAAVPANTDPVAVGSIDAVTLTAGDTSDAMDVSDYFRDADAGDTLTYTAMSDMEMYATAMIDGSMLTITGVAAGSATITVKATDAAGEYATQPIKVTVEAVRRAPANVILNPVGSGIVNVQWEPVPGAHGYYIVAAEASVGGSVRSEAVNGGDSRLGSIGGLTKDVDYLIFVGAFFTLDDYVLEYQETITAE